MGFCRWLLLENVLLKFFVLGKKNISWWWLVIPSSAFRNLKFTYSFLLSFPKTQLDRLPNEGSLPCVFYLVYVEHVPFSKKTNSKGAGRFQNIYLQPAATGCFFVLWVIRTRSISHLQQNVLKRSQFSPESPPHQVWVKEEKNPFPIVS